MRTSDFTTKPSSKVMNETLSKKFGEKLDLENYSDEQLNKAAGLIESRIAVLKKGRFNETLESEEFYRLKLMHDIVRTAITERAKNPYAIGMAAAKKQAGITAKHAHDLPKKVVKKGHEIAKKIKEEKKVDEEPNEGNAFGKAVRDAKKDGIQKGEKIKVGSKTYPVKETSKKKNTMKESYDRYIAEGEEGKAEIIMAVKDMVDKFTTWSENIAQMQAQTAMEMADSIRNEMGNDQAEQFISSVQPALDAAFQAVKSAREALNNTVGTLTGEAPAPMGAEPGMGSDDMDTSVGPDIDIDAEVPGDDAEVDVAAPVDRMKRESIESRLRLAKILVGK